MVTGEPLPSLHERLMRVKAFEKAMRLSSTSSLSSSCEESDCSESVYSNSEGYGSSRKSSVSNGMYSYVLKYMVVSLY